MVAGKEISIQIDTQETMLEGRLVSPVRERAAVITHPHPQYGGNMDNAVVEIISRAYQARGWSTLRFNFRGTGNSQGVFDHGHGEKDDVNAAIAYLLDAGAGEIELAGYSFGAWIISRWAQDNTDHPYTIRLVSPPVAFMDYQGIHRISGLKQVITGDRDDIAPAVMVEDQINKWQPGADFCIIRNADHFFHGQSRLLQTALEQGIPE